MSYETELAAGLKAVRDAAHVCRAVQTNLVKGDTLQKKDKSPVTVADFASQAIVSARLLAALPEDALVGEEDANELRAPEQAGLFSTIVQHVNACLGGAFSPDQVLNWIDHGNADASTQRYWTLDPIDGTKGFLRGEQYAIALALIEQGEVVLGILGCPNLEIGAATGALFYATRNQPALMTPLFSETAASQIQVAAISSAAQARFCESVESGHSNQSESADIAALLGITQEPYRIDSQCKYAAVARNDASIYLRLPTRADYREKIWDHAAGKIIVESAGGRVTDVAGNPLDFSCGTQLERNRGIVATSGSIHDEVLAAVRQVLERES